MADRRGEETILDLGIIGIGSRVEHYERWPVSRSDFGRRG